MLFRSTLPEALDRLHVGAIQTKSLSLKDSSCEAVVTASSRRRSRVDVLPPCRCVFVYLHTTSESEQTERLMRLVANINSLMV